MVKYKINYQLNLPILSLLETVRAKAAKKRTRI